jgi:asparagine N-glycosylation enzyme membrane subunit Stt3
VNDPSQRPPTFSRIASVVLWAFTIGFALGAAQVGKALWSGKVWANYRGDIVTRAEMWRDLIFFVLAALACSALAWHWRRLWRRPS